MLSCKRHSSHMQSSASSVLSAASLLTYHCMHIVQVETRDADFDPQFLRNIFGRIEWDALRDAAASLGEGPFSGMYC